MIAIVVLNDYKSLCGTGIFNLISHCFDRSVTLLLFAVGRRACLVSRILILLTENKGNSMRLKKIHQELISKL